MPKNYAGLHLRSWTWAYLAKLHQSFTVCQSVFIWGWPLLSWYVSEVASENFTIGTMLYSTYSSGSLPRLPIRVTLLRPHMGEERVVECVRYGK